MHLPGHLRDVFGDLVTTVEESGSVPPRTASGETTRRFLSRFAGCTDILPGSLRESVSEQFFQVFGHDCPEQAVGTYARAARRIDELRRGQTDLRL